MQKAIGESLPFASQPNLFLIATIFRVVYRSRKARRFWKEISKCRIEVSTLQSFCFIFISIGQFGNLNPIHVRALTPIGFRDNWSIITIHRRKGSDSFLEQKAENFFYSSVTQRTSLRPRMHFLYFAIKSVILSALVLRQGSRVVD